MNTPRRWLRIGLLIAIFCSVTGGLHAADPAATKNDVPPKGLRVFTCGHSFHVFVPPVLAAIAKSAGIDDHDVAGLSAIGGSRVIQHWNVPDERNKAKELLKAGKVDVLTLSPIYPPDDGIDKFVALALEHNPNIRITLQENWLPFDRYDTTFTERPKTVDHNAPTIADLKAMHAKYFASLDAVAKELNAKHGKQAVFIAPVGQAVVALREKIVAGQASGLTQQSDLFTDAIGHAKPQIVALAGYVHYAVIYHRSPVGLPVPGFLAKGQDPKVAAEQNALLQQIALDAVRTHPLSGYK